MYVLRIITCKKKNEPQFGHIYDSYNMKDTKRRNTDYSSIQKQHKIWCHWKSRGNSLIISSAVRVSVQWTVATSVSYQFVRLNSHISFPGPHVSSTYRHTNYIYSIWIYPYRALNRIVRSNPASLLHWNFRGRPFLRKQIVYLAIVAGGQWQRQRSELWRLREFIQEQMTRQ